MSKYQAFIYKSYEFNPSHKSLRLYYSYDGILEFSERYHFDFDLANYDPLILDRAIQLLFFMAGVSYYKAYVAPEIFIESGEVDKNLAGFLSRTYSRGLAEFMYVNKLVPKTPIMFPINTSLLQSYKYQAKNSLLVGVGGGKDSLVSVEALRHEPDIATWSLSHRLQLSPLVETIGLRHLWVDRQWDRNLLNHNAEGAYNGHIPISAIFACVGLIVAILSDRSDIVVSNEQSANEPSLTYKGIEVNHQYSKSSEFETDFQTTLKALFGEKPKYYSFLRPISEIRIAEIFAKNYFDKYKSVFSSCNRAFTHQNDHIFWCGECPKCAFTFLALSPFLPKPELEKLFGGKNLLLDSKLETTYRHLLGIEGDKPLDCVGEIKESRSAMALAQKIYPQLKKYKFDLPVDYDYRAMRSHNMPEHIYKKLLKIVND